MPHNDDALGALATLLAVVALVIGLMHPSLWWISIVIAVISMLITPWPP